MAYDPNRHHRRSIRLKGYDYAQHGAYFLTLCTFDRKCTFGDVVGGEIVLSDDGRIAHDEWLRSPTIRREIELDAFVVMPNHLHGIVWIREVAAEGGTGGRGGGRPVGDRTARGDRRSPLHHGAPRVPEVEATRPRGPRSKSLGAFVAGYKAAVTRRINQTRVGDRISVWQRNYWEHVIRTEEALEAIRVYILDNPARWALDRLNPAATGTDPRAANLWRLIQDKG